MLVALARRYRVLGGQVFQPLLMATVLAAEVAVELG